MHETCDREDHDAHADTNPHRGRGHRFFVVLTFRMTPQQQHRDGDEREWNQERAIAEQRRQAAGEAGPDRTGQVRRQCKPAQNPDHEQADGRGVAAVTFELGAGRIADP